ncbi:hypothetical protein Syun_000346 [Stephania yunnanensis]|uniref:Uncharacterized protein n=1 Tax=Stephania yunnanensis TaxID=152371 RepID=A0AAP0Q9S7_9MAGN
MAPPLSLPLPRPLMALSFSRSYLVERGDHIWPSSLSDGSARERGAEEADRNSGWSLVMDDGNDSVGGRWLAPAATGHATEMVSD